MRSIIVAVSENGVIGTNNPEPRLLWRLPADMKVFKDTTRGHPVIMGRLTYVSIPQKFRPLDEGRTNIVVTRQDSASFDGCLMAHSLADAFESADRSPGNDEIFIAGGGQLYQEALPHVERIYLTRVHTHIMGEVTFPGPNLEEWELVYSADRQRDERNPHDLTWCVYNRR